MKGMNGHRLAKLISRRLRQVSDPTDISIKFIPQRVCSSVKSRQKFLSKVAFQDTGGICKKKNKYKSQLPLYFRKLLNLGVG